MSEYSSIIKARGHVSSRFQKMMYRPNGIRLKVLFCLSSFLSLAFPAYRSWMKTKKNSETRFTSDHQIPLFLVFFLYFSVSFPPPLIRVTCVHSFYHSFVEARGDMKKSCACVIFGILKFIFFTLTLSTFPF